MTSPRRPRRPVIRTLGVLFLILLLLTNALAFVHARAATTFVPDGLPLETLLTRPLPEQPGALLTGVRLPRPANRATPPTTICPTKPG